MHRGRLAGRKRLLTTGEQVEAVKKWWSHENCSVNPFTELNLQGTPGSGHPSGIFAGSDWLEHRYDIWECRESERASVRSNFVDMKA